MTDDIVEFIKDQLNADEAAGKHLLDWTKHPNPTKPADSFAACMTDAIIGPFNGRTPHTNIQTGMNVVHVADPVRVLADVEAKRAILAEVLSWEHDHVNGDTWLSCAQAVDPHDEDGTPGSGCADEKRAGGPCDCGLDRRRATMLNALAAPYAGRPGFKDEWRLA